MSAVFGHANPLAAYLQMVFIFALGLFADTYQQTAAIGREGRGRYWKSPTLWWLGSMLIICSASLILTSSRAAWAGAVLSSLVFTIYQGWYWILGIVTAIGTVILSAAYAPSPLKAPLRSIVPRYFWARITDEMYPDRPEALTRMAQWKFAWNLTQARPITGWGLQLWATISRVHADLVGLPAQFAIDVILQSRYPSHDRAIWLSWLGFSAVYDPISQFSPPMAIGTNDLFHLSTCLWRVYNI